jgi:hypothetical protein
MIQGIAAGGKIPETVAVRGYRGQLQEGYTWDICRTEEQETFAKGRTRGQLEKERYSGPLQGREITGTVGAHRDIGDSCRIGDTGEYREQVQGRGKQGTAVGGRFRGI